MSLIDKDTLLRELKRRTYEAAEARMTLIAEDFHDLVNDADVVEVPRWIPVTERTPERDAMVLAYFPDMEGTPGRIQTQKGWSVTKFCTHWMPLPEPPEVNDHA